MTRLVLIHGALGFGRRLTLQLGAILDFMAFPDPELALDHVNDQQRPEQSLDCRYPGLLSFNQGECMRLFHACGWLRVADKVARSPVLMQALPSSSGVFLERPDLRTVSCTPSLYWII